MEKRTYYTDRHTVALATYLTKKGKEFYFNGRIIEFEATRDFVEEMMAQSEELAVIPFVVR